LYRDLEEAEDQYQMALRTQLMNIDTLIKLHDSRLYALERNFQGELKTIQTDFLNEKETMISKFNREKRELQSIIDAIEQEEDLRNSEAKHAFEQLREEIRNKNLEEINMLRISLDAQIEELEQHFETAHLNYLQQTAQRTHDFKELTQNDQKLSGEIEKKRKKIDNLQTTIQHWRAKMRQLTRETEERNRLLLDEKHSIQRHYQQLKQRIKVYRTTQNQRLLHLSQSANNCKKVLKDKLDVARGVLQLNELCRRTETMLEQILPFATEEADPNVVYKEELEMQASEGNQNSGKSPDKVKHRNKFGSNQATHVPHQSSVWTGDQRSFVPHADRLTNFYRKYNKILLDNIAINKEKERLQVENAQLQDLIQQYLSGMKISDDILAEDNPLFVVNGR
jgi:chromosome segregation ATPase